MNGAMLPVRVIRDGLENEPAPERSRPLRGAWPHFVSVFGGKRRLPRRLPLETLQINLGLRCNQACRHCHLEAGPSRSEMMDRATLERILALLDGPGGESVGTVDITGGAPELNPDFRFLVRQARRRGKEVIDRCNLTVLLARGQETTATFLAHSGVRIVASLPCYTEANVDSQRGRGVFGRSIDALRRLNRLGYGSGGDLVLDLVYNPLGPALPGSQEGLEADYRRQLDERFGLRFDHLLTITNMPIRRFRTRLEYAGALTAYMHELRGAFNPETIGSLMCRTTLSVGWDGRLFDCDFNQAAGIDLPRRDRTVWTLESLAALDGDPIAFSDHCYGCTAGPGSSCGGAIC